MNSSRMSWPSPAESQWRETRAQPDRPNRASYSGTQDNYKSPGLHRDQYQDQRQRYQFQLPQFQRNQFQDQYQRKQPENPYNQESPYQRHHFQNPYYQRPQFQNPPGTFSYSAIKEGGPQQSPQLTLVLLGRTNTGKSTCANTIMGYSAFSKDPDRYLDETIVCKKKTKSIGGTRVNIIDTPDFFHPWIQTPETHFRDCRNLCEGGLCVYLLVVDVSTYIGLPETDLEKLEAGLGTRVRDRAMILFTYGEKLGYLRFDEYIKDKPDLRKFIVRFAYRYQVFNNKDYSKAQQQRKELLEKIATFVQRTYGVKVFTKHQDSNCVYS